MFLARFVAVALTLCASACGSSIGEAPGGEGRADAGPVPVPDSGTPAAADAALPDGAPAEPDAAAPGVPATVTASCLYLRQGPGTDQPKVACVDAGPWCDAANDVCIPMGETVEISGEPVAGAGCTEWYATSYRDYDGWTCGEYLAVSSSALLPAPKGPTRYPSVSSGPRG